MNRKLVTIILALTVAFGLTACEENQSAREKDEKTSEQLLRDLQRAHPTPKFRRSQLRQNLVEIVTAQAETTQTTSFFFNQGVTNPIHSCPSIGFPIASTAQLTNPSQISREATVIPQVEPSGIFTGDSSGTYVICIDAKGKAYASYWEGFVQTVTGPAEWRDGAVKLVGPPSFDFSNGR